MLICFCGSGSTTYEVVKAIVSREHANTLLALPAKKIEKEALSVFKTSDVDCSVYAIESWKSRVDAAVDRLKEFDGKMILFPESKVTLSVSEEYVALVCKEKGVSISIIKEGV